MRKVLLTGFALATIFSQSAMATGKARLAVLPARFSSSFNPVIEVTVVGEASEQGKLEFSYRREAAMENPSYTASLVDAFVASRKFEILERSRLQAVIDELDFGESDYADTEKCVKLGSALNAQYVLLSQIELLHLVRETKDVPYIDNTQVRYRTKMIVRSRVVDVSTSEVVSSFLQTVTDTYRQKSSDPFKATTGIDAVLSLYGAISKQVLRKTISSIYPVRILDVTNGIASLNRGEGVFEEGDLLDVYEEGKTLVDPQTGEDLGASEQHLGQLLVTAVKPKFSEATIKTGEDKITTADLDKLICRESEASIERKTNAANPRINW